MVSDIRRSSYIEDVWEYGAEEERSGRRMNIQL
jgi:hypothetical protein